ncbi:Vam6/Vps39-like protein [Chamberlinius hualienensis]
MHDAYRVVPLIEKLPLQIESIAAYDDNLVVGTKEGHLLVYRTSSSLTPEVQLLKSNKCFAKRPIIQLAVVADLRIVISLSDGIVSVHDLAMLNTPIMSIARTKGATLFAVDVKKISDEASCSLRMCVVVKKKIQLYEWQNRTFHELPTAGNGELNLPAVPKMVQWYGDSLCVGFRGEYFLIKVKGDQKELFPTGKSLEPRICKLLNNRFALGRDEHTILIDLEGNPTQRHPITWSDIPINMEHDNPYFVSILPKCIEVRNIDPRMLIQTIELPKARLIAQCSRGRLIVASNTHIWALTAMPISEQIPALVIDGHFELALKLTDVSDEDDEDKNNRIKYIKNLYAFNLFCKMQFKNSLDIFSDLGTDPSHVIGLFPDLLPHGYREQLKYPNDVPALAGSDLENGLTALIDYLTQTRHSLLGILGQNNVDHAASIVEGNTVIQSNKQLLQIIDTTLLKCYLQTNDALVASLLRLPDNHCHIEEAERALQKNLKYSELIILYQRKGLHQKALDLLLKHAKRPDSPLKGHERTIQYLQHLGKDHLGLIFEFSGWVLKAYPDDGLKIFTEGLPEVKDLPRDKVLGFLIKTEKSLAITYLQHVINVWKDETPDFHNALISQYREKTQSLAIELSSFSNSDSTPSVLSKREELKSLRGRLIEFLKTSEFYNPEDISHRFPYDGFYEEQAILSGKMGRHEKALAIYTHVLKNFDLAEEYCRKTYDKEKDGNKEVYLLLLKLYAAPPETALVGILPPTGPKPKPNIALALKVLQEHPAEIDPIKAIDILPESIKVKDLRDYLDHVTLVVVKQKHTLNVLMSLLYAEHLQVKVQKIQTLKKKIVIDEFNNCTACKKRISNSAFARYPNGDIVHYFCREKYQASLS